MPPAIDDAAHPRVRAARRLHAPAGRRRSGLFLAEGVQAAREAVRRAGVVRELFVTPEWRAEPPLDPGQLAAQGVPVHHVTERVLARLAETSTPQGVVAVCRDVTVGLAQVLAGSPRLLVVLAQVRDPGNAGTIIRTADAAGADGVLLTQGSVDPLGGKSVRSTAGSLFHLPISVGQPPEVLASLREAGLRVLVADGSGSLDLYEALGSGLLAEPTAWVVGNEAWGVAPELREHADAVVAVPLYGQAESLNVSVAAALCLYASAQAQRPTGAPAAHRPLPVGSGPPRLDAPTPS